VSFRLGGVKENGIAFVIERLVLAKSSKAPVVPCQPSAAPI
jgi:hypothetical protein